MVAVCYAGLGVLVTLAYVINMVAPSAVAMPLFIIGSVLLVGGLHPRRAHTLRTFRH